MKRKRSLETKREATSRKRSAPKVSFRNRFRRRRIRGLKIVLRKLSKTKIDGNGERGILTMEEMKKTEMANSRPRMGLSHRHINDLQS